MITLKTGRTSARQPHNDMYVREGYGYLTAHISNSYLYLSLQRYFVVNKNNPIKDRVERTFDYTSTNYDNYVEKTMTLTSNLLLREVKIPENPTALDVACGTGISTIELVKRCNGLGSFIGIDI